MSQPSWQIPLGFRAPMTWMVMAVVLFTISQLAPVTNSITGSASFAGIHMVLELAAIAISLMVFALAWNLRKSPVNNYVIVIGLTSFAGLALDIPHALAYQGMPDFITPASTEKSIYFWLLARFCTAIGLLVVALMKPAQWPARRWWQGLAGVLAFVTLAWTVGMWHLDLFPATFSPEQGLTDFKIASEYAISLLFTRLFNFERGGAWSLMLVWTVRCG